MTGEDRGNSDKGSSDDAQIIKHVDGSLAQSNGGSASPPNLVNVNMIFTAVVQREDDPAQWEARTKAMLAVARQADEQEIEMFEKRAAAIIRAKNSDPDYIDRRANSQSRRFLRYTVGVVAVLAPIAFIALSQVPNVPWPVVSAVIALGAAALALAAGLGSGGDAPGPEELRALVQAVTGRSSEQKVDSPAKRTQPVPRKGKRR